MTNAYRPIVVALLASLVGTFLAADKWGDVAVWPAVVANFAASLLAFMPALAWGERS